MAIATGLLIGPAAVAAEPGYDVPLVPMRAVPLERSVAQLAAEGWRIVAVTQSQRAFVYHLTGPGTLAICIVNTTLALPASECVQLTPSGP